MTSSSQPSPPASDPPPSSPPTDGHSKALWWTIVGVCSSIVIGIAGLMIGYAGLRGSGEQSSERSAVEVKGDLPVETVVDDGAMAAVPGSPNAAELAAGPVNDQAPPAEEAALPMRAPVAEPVSEPVAAPPPSPRPANASKNCPNRIITVSFPGPGGAGSAYAAFGKVNHVEMINCDDPSGGAFETRFDKEYGSINGSGSFNDQTISFTFAFKTRYAIYKKVSCTVSGDSAGTRVYKGSISCSDMRDHHLNSDDVTIKL